MFEFATDDFKFVEITGLRGSTLALQRSPAEFAMNPSPFDAVAPTFGLPSCLWVPIAARDEASIEAFVGTIEERRFRKSGEVGALKVKPFQRGLPVNATAPIWSSDQADTATRLLFPDYQVWVHVDYQRYRQAYLAFGLPPPREGEFLDHVQNRKAIRLRWYSHPFVRLAPVARAVNTSGGHSSGGEGMECEYLRSLQDKPEAAAELRALVESYRVQYADPMDLTKMLNLPPGTETLPGVAEVQRMFFPKLTEC